jgi:hypothetical protein
MKAFVKQLIKAKETKALKICFEANPEYFWEEVKSSNIKRVRHNHGSSKEFKVMDIEFNSGQVYRYQAVPIELYKELLKAESIGKFLNENIKGTYDYSLFTSKK